MHKACCNEAVERHEALPEEMKEVWEYQRRNHLEEQPSIKHKIIEAILKNPKRSWEGLAADINHWCSAATIWRWVTSRTGCKVCCERVIPLLSTEQKTSHLNFAKKFRDNWGLGPGKCLWTMHDEKWFWGLVTRKGAKMCEELGIDPETFSAYHKSHINKTMGIAFTAFAFEDSIENGGKAIKLDFVRAQGFKVADKEQRAAVRHDDGRITFSGPILRRKDDICPVDCAVTGSSHGTATNPKKPLLPEFQNNIFNRIEALTGPGGEFEGFTVIFQGDNAGPHQDATFLRGVRSFCAAKGWHWEPQAAQMPHMNVLDLSVFPCMSRRHIQKAEEVGGLKVLTEDEIWNVASDVWSTLANSKIASGHIQAHRVAGEVIKAGGSNEFLGVGGNIHSGVRKDFHETATGLKRKDGTHIAGPALQNQCCQCFLLLFCSGLTIALVIWLIAEVVQNA